ncbi:hypothetical protein [Thermosphaera sp.]
MDSSTIVVKYLAYTWEPKWEAIRLESNGIILTTCRDKVTGLIACPICLNANSTCLGKSATHTEIKSEISLFFSIDDLIEHIKNFHSRGLSSKLEEIRKRMGEARSD